MGAIGAVVIVGALTILKKRLNRMTLIPFEDADAVGDRFLALLSKHNIQPPLYSLMENQLLSLTDLIEVTKNPSRARGANEVEILRAAAGVHDFAAKVLSVEPVPDFQEVLSHLRLIKSPKVRSATLVQNATGAYDDDTGRKMAELYMGCLAANAGTDLVLDDPSGGTGKRDNPDVIFTPAGSSERWALAIKTPGRSNPQTFFDRINEGADQINDSRCLAQKGMVVINAKDALDHDALWNTQFKDLDEAKVALREQLERIANAAAANRSKQDWDSMFTGKAVRPVLFLGQSVVRLPIFPHGEVPTPLKMLLVYPANGTPDQTAHSLADDLNFLMQTILRGIPGKPGHPPQ